MDNFTTKYEYEIVDGNVDDVQLRLSRWGMKGFQVVSHVVQPPITADGPYWHTVIMARELPNESDGHELLS